MLRELHIVNLAVIEDATLELRDGLNCFTGQTGAGKSLVIGAFEAMLGLRGATDLLRDGAEEGRVSGVFELRDAETVRAIAAAADLELDPQSACETLLITRKMFASGRTTFSINGAPATAAMARAVGELLVDVHGQHDHQYLLKPANQSEMLDRFAGCGGLRERFAELHGRLGELRRRRGELAASQELRRQQLELYEFQADEMDRVDAKEGEFEEVEARHRLLANLEKVRRDAAAAHGVLYEAEGSVLERLQAVTGLLRQLSELDEELSPVAESVKTAAAQVQDAAFDLSRYMHRIELDPAELAEVSDRLSAMNRLIHKYARGGAMREVLEYRAQIAEKIDRLRGEVADESGLESQIEPLRREWLKVGEELSEARKAAAAKIKPLIERELGELGMAGAVLDIVFEKLEEGGAGPSGLDAVEMLVQPNPGQAPRPLRKIASGGELSRVMLAIKTILAGRDRIGVLVFDEIDANIGGRIASVVGGKLRALAAHHQVLCITHLPQIAAFADHHLKISKTVSAGRTATRVEPLMEQERRVEELSEMLTGQSKSDTTRLQARELIELAEKKHPGGAEKAGRIVKPKTGHKLRLSA